MNAARATVRTSRDVLVGRRILIVGAGGLGCPAALALEECGATLVIADDDVVEVSNLQRQILYDEADVGRDKLSALRAALLRRGLPPERLVLERTRVLPENARALVQSVDLVLEGADNYATKFLVADACRLEARPVVHGSAIRWVATVFSVSAQGRPCYRCLFEDVPPGGAQQTCAEAGVMGPVVGLAAALMADSALRSLANVDPREGRILSYDGRSDRIRELSPNARVSCPLCGPARSIFEIEETRYTAPGCAA